MTQSMTCEQFETILAQLLDDESSATAMTPIVRAHLDGCAECRSLLEDLSAIRSEARALPPLSPSRDLWSGIATRIDAPVVPLVDGVRARPSRRQMSWRSAGVAAAALVAMTTAITYRVARYTPTTEVTMTAEAPATRPASNAAVPTGLGDPASMPVMGVRTPARPTIVLATNQDGQSRQREAAKVVYDREITRLRAVVDSGRTKLDPATVAILDRNLRIIDMAIEQCREALAGNSASTFLIESLNNVYQTKVKLLRIAAAAASSG